MKIGKLSLILGCVVLIIAGFVIEKNVLYRSMGSGSSPASFPRYYESLAQLREDAVLVIYGRVPKAGDSLMYHNEMLITLTSVQVEEILKDTTNSSPQEITVLEEGGRKDGKAVGGFSPVMEEGKKYVLFLGKPLTSDVPENSYIILGSFMGKFEVGASGALKYLGPTGEVKALQDEVRSTRLGNLPERLKKKD